MGRSRQMSTEEQQKVCTDAQLFVHVPGLFWRCKMITSFLPRRNLLSWAGSCHQRLNPHLGPLCLSVKLLPVSSSWSYLSEDKNISVWALYAIYLLFRIWNEDISQYTKLNNQNTAASSCISTQIYLLFYHECLSKTLICFIFCFSS